MQNMQGEDEPGGRFGIRIGQAGPEGGMDEDDSAILRLRDGRIVRGYRVHGSCLPSRYRWRAFEVPPERGWLAAVDAGGPATWRPMNPETSGIRGASSAELSAPATPLFSRSLGATLSFSCSSLT